MDARSLEEICQTAHSEKATERLQAVWSLGELFTAQARCLPVLRAALGDPDADVRGTAAEALGKLGAVVTDAVSLLLEALAVEEATDFRARVVYSLGRCGPGAAAAVPHLVGLVRGRDPHAAWAALWSLGEIGLQGPEVLPALLSGLSSPAASHRFVAAWALGHLGASAWGAEERLRATARDVHPLVAETARWALGEIMGTFGAPQDSGAAREAPPAAEAASAKAALNRLRRQLSDGRRSVRLAAAWAAGEMGPPGAALAKELVGILSQADAELQGAAAESLGKIGHGSAEVAGLLADRLAEEACPVRSQIAYALGWMGQAAHGSVAKMLRFVRASAGVSHRQIEARWAAVCSLGLLRAPDQALVTELSGILTDPESDVRFMAAESLGYLGAAATAAVAALRAAAADPHWTVRARAAWALSRISP